MTPKLWKYYNASFRHLLTFLENQKKKEEKVMTLVKFYFCKLGQNYDFKQTMSSLQYGSHALFEWLRGIAIIPGGDGYY